MITPPVALITGVFGQDGSYLAERLVSDGWTVHGVHRPGSAPAGQDAPDLTGVVLHAVDLVDERATARLMAEVAPRYVFHLAGMSSVAQSWNDPMTTVQVNAVASTALLNLSLVEQERSGEPVVFVNASSAEIFGTRDGRRTESDPLTPTSPYGASKAYAHQLGAVYRSRGLAVNNAILFNHESPRRGVGFVTGKIAHGAAMIARGERDQLSLGDLDSRRDWGWAPDYVDAMVRMARTGTGDDYVIATGRSHSVRDFVVAAFAAAGIDDWEPYVWLDTSYLRPVDPADCVGDATHARETLGWAPTVEFGDIVGAMVESHMNSQIPHALKKERV